jgi:hypothetical protein
VNEGSYGSRSPGYEEGAAPFTPAPLTGCSISPQELSQQILVGMQSGIEAQVDWRLQQRAAKSGSGSAKNVGLILGSLGIGIPLMGIAAPFGGLPGIIAVCIMLISVNAVWAGHAS